MNTPLTTLCRTAMSNGHVAPMSNVDISQSPLRGDREICNEGWTSPFAYAGASTLIILAKP